MKKETICIRYSLSPESYTIYYFIMLLPKVVIVHLQLNYYNNVEIIYFGIRNQSINYFNYRLKCFEI